MGLRPHPARYRDLTMTSMQNEGVRQDTLPLLARCLGWSLLAVLAVFLINNILTYGLGWPGAGTASGLAWTQLTLYGIGPLRRSAMPSER